MCYSVEDYSICMEANNAVSWLVRRDLIHRLVRNSCGEL